MPDISTIKVPTDSSRGTPYGTWAYKAGTLTGAGNVTLAGRCVRIRIAASGADGEAKINGGDTIKIRNGDVFDAYPNGNVLTPLIAWVSGTIDIYVEAVSNP